MARAFDVVVLGATGYTGRMVVEYLTKSSSAAKLRWAAAGRSKSKVEAALADAGANVPVLVADTSDAASIESVARQCVVVIACAGPFDIHGPPVLAACLKEKTHYVDITGEFTYVRKAIEQYHDAALRAGLFFVPTCGFDSVPSDVGNFLLTEEAKARGTHVVLAHSYFAGKGGVSGGTAATMCNIFKTIQKADMRRNSLNPRDGPEPVALPTKAVFSFDPWVGRWTAPFIMSGINERVVRRSNALFGLTGAYSEVAACSSLVAAVITTLGFYAVSLLMLVPLVRSLAQKYVLPAPGTGPDATAMATSHFAVQYRAKTSDGQLLAASMKYNRSAYVFTAVAVAECAMCVVDLEKRGAEKRAASGLPGGVLTPSSAFGQRLVDRLVASGVDISVSREKSK